MRRPVRTAPTLGEPGGKAARRKNGHDERIEPITKEREAVVKAEKARR